MKHKTVQGFYKTVCVFVIPWTYAPVASKLGVALQATRFPLLSVPRIALLSVASFVDWAPSGLPVNAQCNDTNTPNVLLNLCTLLFYAQLLLQKTINGQ